MTWEKFRLSGKDIVPRITIGKTGRLSLSQSAITSYKLDNYKYVILYADRDSKRIGMKFTNDEKEEGARKLRFHPAGGAAIAARSFVALYGLGSFRRLNCEYDEKEKMLIASYA